MVNNMFIWAVLAIIPILCYIYIFFFKKFRIVIFSIGLIVYLWTIVFLRYYKGLQGRLITQQACDTQNGIHIANYGQCSSILKSTIDLENKGVGWMNCLISVAKKEIIPWSQKAKDCDYIWQLYNTSAREWEEQYEDYILKMAK